MIKKYQIILFATLLSLFSCNKYDDTAVWDRLDNHKERIETLETLCSRMNTNVASLKAILSALEKNNYVTSVTPVVEGSKTIGYTITFVKGSPITVYHGENGKDGTNGTDGNPGADGKDGHTPVIGIEKDENGVYCWTLDGDWLLDSAGNRIYAEGQDGENGTDGADGADGHIPVIGVEKYSDGYYYWTLDGEWLKDSVGNMVRAEGLDGENGNDGIPGADGEDGKDGADGHSPVVGVEKYSDGYYYWTLDGEWLKDAGGSMIRAEGLDGADGVDGSDGQDGAPGQNGSDGQDGVTPQLKIEDGYWYISYDNGAGWTKLDKAVGEDGQDGAYVFEKVTQDAENVYFTLSDGTEITLPKSKDGTQAVDRASLAGMWAVVDADGMCNEYIKFDHLFSQYISDYRYPYQNGIIYGGEAYFKRKRNEVFYVENDDIYLDGNRWGTAVLSDDILSVSGKIYKRIEQFKFIFMNTGPIICDNLGTFS